MPVNKKTTQENIKTDDVVVNSTNNDEIEQIKKENEELKNNINILMEQMTKLLEKQNTPETVSTTSTTNNYIEDDSLEYPEPDANKQIRLVSMYYGSLTLCNSMNRNTARMLTFSKFGEIKSVLYHDLVDFVNNERKFAEAGYFYILDKAAVYHLGLSSDYKKLVDAETAFSSWDGYFILANDIDATGYVHLHEVSNAEILMSDSTVGLLGTFDGQGYAINNLTVGSGGLFGVGIGNSTQKYMYMSEPHNDFIFAIWAEEFGFVGVVFVLVLFGIFIWRGMTIALKAQDMFGTLLALGITTLIAVQALLNIAIVSALFPVTGIPLPFFSYRRNCVNYYFISMWCFAKYIT